MRASNETARFFCVAFGIAVAALVLIVSAQMLQSLGAGAGAPNAGRAVVIGGGKVAKLFGTDLQSELRRLDKAVARVESELEALNEHAPAEPPTSRPIPPRPKLPFHHTNNTIFVSLASYRDPDCAETVASMFRHADQPGRVHVGIVEQHGDAEWNCIPKNFSSCQPKDVCYSDNIKRRKVDPKLARGPAMGRYFASLLYRGETFYLQIDSHMHFIPHWDTVLLNMHALAKKMVRKPVLSHYPEAYEAPPNGTEFKWERDTTSYLCKVHYTADALLRFDAIIIERPVAPKPSPFAAAGFLFAEGAVLHEVPLDPHLPYLFDGEEILYSARLWTNGWDIFSPSQTIAYHKYSRKDAPKVFADHSTVASSTQKQSQMRVHYILETKELTTTKNLIDDKTDLAHVIIEADKYGLGTERSIDAYWRLAGIDTVKQQVTGSWCV